MEEPWMPGRLARVIACVVSLIAVATAIPLAAQIGAGALAGDIVDQAGAAVPGATITVVAEGTNRSRTAVTGLDGSYRAPGLAPGLYRIRVELNGFRPLTRNGVRIATGETVRLDLTLTVGGV